MDSVSKARDTGIPRFHPRTEKVAEYPVPSRNVTIPRGACGTRSSHWEIGMLDPGV